MRAIDLERNTLQWKKIACVSLDGQTADTYLHDSATRSRRINYAAFYLHLHGMHKGSSRDAAASNSVAKAGCAAKRSASSALGTHVWTVLTHFAAVCTVCIRRAHPFKGDRGEKTRFTYLDARMQKMYSKIGSRYFNVSQRNKKVSLISLYKH